MVASIGDVFEWIRLEAQIAELFDIAVLPRVRCPMALGPDTQEIRSTVTFEAMPAA